MAVETSPDHVRDHSSLRGFVRDVADYPTDGITFRDITPLLGDSVAFSQAVSGLVDEFAGVAVDRVVGMEARGFIFGAAVAYRIGAGFVPVRKPGKLPWAVVREEYQLEYGSDKLEIHRDAIHPGERILIVDDVLATGGTAQATAKLVETLGGVVAGLGFVLELDSLGGRSRLGERSVKSLLRYN
ncbi:MAG: adenine phosphoribosyltransferase [Ilumatobacter sp.]|jgi:adenine phosphoribosyltransferase|uniref:adenine phosphoribosyltransferase n=1 Tax=Ilumatobacter sp. TaxID=1967498 RepID=UPI00391BA960